MGEQNHWLHGVCRFWTYCRRTWAGGTEAGKGFSDDQLHIELPGSETFLGFLDGKTEMPERCKMFLGFVNILAVAIVVGLAMESASPKEPQVQTSDDNHDRRDQRNVREEDPHTRHPDAGQGVQKPTAEASTGPNVKEEVKPPETSIRTAQGTSKAVERTAPASGTSKAVERTAPGTSKAPERTAPGTIKGAERTAQVTIKAAERAAPGTSAASEQQGGVCQYCTVLARKVIRLLTECGCCKGEKQPGCCGICSGVERSPRSPQDLPSAARTRGRDREGAAQGKLKRPRQDLQGGIPSHPVKSPLTLYWRNRVLDILAPSLPPLPDLFHDWDKMSETGQNSGGDVVEGGEDQGHDEPELTRFRIVGNVGESEQETAQDISHGLRETHTADQNLETILENEDNIAATQRARARTDRVDPLRDELLRGRNPSPPRVRIVLPASVLAPQPISPDRNSTYPAPSTVHAARPATPPGADRNDSRPNAPMLHTRSFVVTINTTSAPTETAQPASTPAPLPEYYYRPTGGNSSNDVQYFWSGDDELTSQSSRPPSSRSHSRPRSTPVPLRRPRLAVNATAQRPRGRVLARRPKCGLRMMKALRDDPTCTVEEGEARRQPGREDKFFAPMRGDVICRHTAAPGRGVVEIYSPGIEQHLADGDTLVRLKMDNTSYPTMLILSTNAYLFLQGKWMYLGRHQHGVRKPKKEWCRG